MPSGVPGMRRGYGFGLRTMVLTPDTSGAAEVAVGSIDLLRAGASHNWRPRFQGSHSGAERGKKVSGVRSRTPFAVRVWTTAGVGRRADRLSSVVMKIGIGVGSQPPFGSAKRRVTAAKVARLDSLWVIDHWVGFLPRSIWTKDLSHLASPRGADAFFEWQTLMGALAGRVGNLQLGVGVTEPIRRHPVLLAQAAMTLSHLTKKPPILGIGCGEAENIIPYGLDFSTPVSQLEEALQIMRLCFESDYTFDYHGDHYNLDRAIMDLRPKRGNEPEIWVAAHGPRMLRITGAYADGWFPALPLTASDYESKLRTIHEAATAASRDNTNFTGGMSLFFAMAQTKEKARAALNTSMARFYALLSPDYYWQEFGVEHPLGKGFRGMIDIIPQDYTREELLAAMDKVPEDLVAAVVPWGTPDDIIAYLRDLEDAGLEHVQLNPLSAIMSADLARFTPRAIWKIVRAMR